MVAVLALLFVSKQWIERERRRNPAYDARLRQLEQRRREREQRRLSTALRVVFGIVAAFCTAAAIGLGMIVWTDHDLGLFFMLFLGPALYLAIVFWYMALSGRQTSFADAFVFWT